MDKNKYPPIDGKNYCKIHWKQLTAEKAGEADTDSGAVLTPPADFSLPAEPEPSGEASETSVAPETAAAA